VLVKPNKTVLRGRVIAVRADAGNQQGRELDIDVTENCSPAPHEDFLKPKAGEPITLYSSETHAPAPGDLVEVEATLLAGPFGERAVTQRIKKLQK